MTTNSPDKINKAASSIDDPEQGAVADVPNPEYTINDVAFLLFSFPAAFFTTFGLAPFIDIPHWGAPPSADTWADPRSKLNFVVQYGAAIALVIRLFRFCWMHRWDVYVWGASNLGGFLSAHALRLALRPAFPRDFLLDASYFVPWTYVGSLLVYVIYRLRQPERLLKQ